MSRKPEPLAVDYGERFRERLLALDAAGRGGCAKVISALIAQEPTPGMRVKPIPPDRVYREARISSGDRLVFRIEGRVLYLIDVVHHDDISRYRRRPQAAALSGRSSGMPAADRVGCPTEIHSKPAEEVITPWTSHS